MPVGKVDIKVISIRLVDPRSLLAILILKVVKLTNAIFYFTETLLMYNTSILIFNKVQAIRPRFILELQGVPHQIRPRQ